MDQLLQFISHHPYLWLALILILVAILINELLSQKNKAKGLSPALLVEKINEGAVVLIDLRDKEAYAKGHIIGSMQMKSTDLDPKKLAKYKTKSIVLICDKGLQSPPAAAKLRTEGLQTLVLNGGIASWQNADLPLVKEKS